MHVSPRSSFVAVVCLAAVFLTTACTGASASRDTITGAELYRACAACHGPVGGGDRTQSAPAIAGMPAWYVAAQLERFQSGIRGKHPDDVEGLRMRPMSLQMRTESERLAVAEYVAGLPQIRNPATLTGTDLAVGAQSFALCVTCHGPNGEGNEVANAPPLAGLDDWYVALQIRKYRSGIRGTAPGDAFGPIMAAMSMAVQPDAIDDVAAHVHALPRQP